MRIRFTIGRRITTGFGVVILLILLVFTITFNTVNNGVTAFQEGRRNIDMRNKVIEPSLRIIRKLRYHINDSKALITQWAVAESKAETDKKIELRDITIQKVPFAKISLLQRIPKWGDEQDKKDAREIFDNIDELFFMHDEIKHGLPNLESYRSTNYFLYLGLVGPSGKITLKTEEILDKIKKLENSISLKYKNLSSTTTISFHKIQDSFNFLLNLVVYSFLILVIGSVFIASFTTRSIVKPVRKLKKTLLSLGKGIFPKDKMGVTDDEIGEMSVALNMLVDGLKQTTEFSKAIGSGNFDYNYHPLSKDDVLGHALLLMRGDLAENERILERKVIERTEEVVRQRDELEQQRQKLEELYNDITDSIRYAKRLQYSILPSRHQIDEVLSNYFVFFQPRDIVSGDFYWFQELENKVLFAAVDCTGHGVPGAFMSIVGANALNQSVKENKRITPSLILEDLNQMAYEQLNKGNDSLVRDGMDLAICALDREKRILEYSGANNPLYIMRDGKLLQIKPDKRAIGASSRGFEYTNHVIQLEKDDMIYVFSDGYPDQFGGAKGKKFMYKRFRDLLLSISSHSVEQQKLMLKDSLDLWKGNLGQVDDILVIGVRV